MSGEVQRAKGSVPEAVIRDVVCVCRNICEGEEEHGAGAAQRDVELGRYLLDVGDIQGSVDQSSVHGVFSVFAFFVQVHRLQ